MIKINTNKTMRAWLDINIRMSMLFLFHSFFLALTHHPTSKRKFQTPFFFSFHGYPVTLFWAQCAGGQNASLSCSLAAAPVKSDSWKGHTNTVYSSPRLLCIAEPETASSISQHGRPIVGHCRCHAFFSTSRFHLFIYFFSRRVLSRCCLYPNRSSQKILVPELR